MCPAESIGPAKLVCAACNGNHTRTGPVHHNTGPDSSGHYWTEETSICHVCEGRGWNYLARQAAYLEARRSRDARVARGETMYDAALRLGIRTSELSGHESGRTGLPPHEEPSR